MLKLFQKLSGSSSSSSSELIQKERCRFGKKDVDGLVSCESEKRVRGEERRDDEKDSKTLNYVI